MIVGGGGADAGACVACTDVVGWAALLPTRQDKAKFVGFVDRQTRGQRVAHTTVGTRRERHQLLTQTPIQSGLRDKFAESRQLPFFALRPHSGVISQKSCLPGGAQ